MFEVYADAPTLKAHGQHPHVIEANKKLEKMLRRVSSLLAPRTLSTTIATFKSEKVSVWDCNEDKTECKKVDIFDPVHKKYFKECKKEVGGDPQKLIKCMDSKDPDWKTLVEQEEEIAEKYRSETSWEDIHQQNQKK